MYEGIVSRDVFPVSYFLSSNNEIYTNLAHFNVKSIFIAAEFEVLLSGLMIVVYFTHQHASFR